MSEKLKPCPDCNNTAIELWVDDDGEALYHCESCGFCSLWSKNAVEAKQKWNSLPRYDPKAAYSPQVKEATCKKKY